MSLIQEEHGQRKLFGVRLVAENQVRNMSDGSLKLYARQARKLQLIAHRMGKDFCCETCYHVVHQRDLTEDETAAVRAADYVANATKRELRARVDRAWAQS